MPGDDLLGTVELLGEHCAGQQVRPGHGAERQRQAASPQQILAMPVGTADQEGELGHALVAPGRKLAREPGLWPRALEELLRYESPVQGLARATTRDVELHGVTIPAGDQVLILYGSANHDEAVFPDPDVLDVGREVRSHWTFGRGIHHCLGNAVARLEVRVALEALLEAHPDFGVDEGGIVRNQLVPTRGVAHAPIDF